MEPQRVPPSFGSLNAGGQVDTAESLKSGEEPVLFAHRIWQGFWQVALMHGAQQGFDRLNDRVVSHAFNGGVKHEGLFCLGFRPLRIEIGIDWVIEWFNLGVD